MTARFDAEQTTRHGRDHADWSDTGLTHADACHSNGYGVHVYGEQPGCPKCCGCEKHRGAVA